MEIKISFKHLDHSDELKEFTEQKTQKLKKYFDGRVSVTWNFSIEKHERIAHCHMVGNHMDYFGEARSEDMRESIDLAVDHIEKQLRRKKEIIKNHKVG